MDVVRAVFAAFAERDVEGVLAHASADIELSAEDVATIARIGEER